MDSEFFPDYSLPDVLIRCLAFCRLSKLIVFKSPVRQTTRVIRLLAASEELWEVVFIDQKLPRDQRAN